METDAAVIARIKAGERDAYRILVERHSRVVFRLAYRIVQNETDAEDVVQETFMRAYQHLDRFDMAASFTTWLYRIASNYSLDLLRARQRQATVTPVSSTAAGNEEVGEDFLSSAVAHPGPSPDRLLLSREVEQRVASALETLSAQERTAFVLRHFEGQSIEEIGQVLGASGAATKQSIFRAVQKLRRVLEPFVRATA